MQMTPKFNCAAKSLLSHKWCPSAVSKPMIGCARASFGLIRTKLKQLSLVKREIDSGQSCLKLSWLTGKPEAIRPSGKQFCGSLLGASVLILTEIKNPVRNVGVLTDAGVNVNSHTKPLTKSTYYHLSNIAMMRGFMFYEDKNTEHINS